MELGYGGGGGWGQAGVRQQDGVAGRGTPLRLRGGAFWFSAVAGLPEKEVFFRTIRCNLDSEGWLMALACALEPWRPPTKKTAREHSF